MKVKSIIPEAIRGLVASRPNSQKINYPPPVQSFLRHMQSAEFEDLNCILDAALQFEEGLRQLFCNDPHNPLLHNPHIGLIRIFDPDLPPTIFLSRPRTVQKDQQHYMFPLSAERRLPLGATIVVNGIRQFERNWQIFTEGSLSDLDWSNTLAAGGSVLACVQPNLNRMPRPGPDGHVSKAEIRKIYHNESYPTSDIDIFLWGLTPIQAEAKIKQIFNSVRERVPHTVLCVRTKHTVSIHSQHPFRTIQIVLRLYQSPAEILAGFDIDAPSIAYDGSQVFASPRAIIALSRQSNTIDLSRRSPSYEMRLAKYASRGFEIYIPELRREAISPSLFEKPIRCLHGLARLASLEYWMLHPRSRVSTRNLQLDHVGDLDHLSESNYETVALRIPYKEGWSSRKTEKLLTLVDQKINGESNIRSRYGGRLHCHPAVWGTTMADCLDEKCKECPVPENAEEAFYQVELSKKYVVGRVSFIEQNPGQQLVTGSFNPINGDDWSSGAYRSADEVFFDAIASGDSDTVLGLLTEGSQRVAVSGGGWTALQLGIKHGELFHAAGARWPTKIASEIELPAYEAQSRVHCKRSGLSTLSDQVDRLSQSVLRLLEKLVTLFKPSSIPE